jgi:hypothetical protein
MEHGLDGDRVIAFSDLELAENPPRSIPSSSLRGLDA